MSRRIITESVLEESNDFGANYKKITVAPNALSQPEGKMSTKKPKHHIYGPHLMLDCYEADSGKLADINKIFQFLDQLPKLIGMKKIGPPQLCQFTDSKKAGVTGVVMIVTSHISIHTYSLRRCFFLDIFSCQKFDRKYVEEHVRDTFSVGRMHSRLVQRGRWFPAAAHFAESAKRGQS